MAGHERIFILSEPTPSIRRKHGIQMEQQREGSTIVMADDDPEDCLLTQLAWEESGSPLQTRFVRDGEELLNYLYHRGKYANSQEYPLPSMIHLDLDMPKRNGHTVLQEMRDYEEFRHIPTVMFTHSLDEEGTCRTYGLGANACMTKPKSTHEYHSLINSLSQYWPNMVHLPSTAIQDDFYHPIRSWL